MENIYYLNCGNNFDGCLLTGDLEDQKILVAPKINVNGNLTLGIKSCYTLEGRSITRRRSGSVGKRPGQQKGGNNDQPC